MTTCGLVNSALIQPRREERSHCRVVVSRTPLRVHLHPLPVVMFVRGDGLLIAGFMNMYNESIPTEETRRATMKAQRVESQKQ